MINLEKIYKKASFCRAFEEKVYSLIEQKIIKFPVYLSAGEEFLSATISEMVDQNNKPLIFPQHRNHSIYLNFGGNPYGLAKELLGRNDGCTNGMGGSASIHSLEQDIYGHDGMLGSNVPIAVGACLASKRPTVVFCGDAAIEEDYALASIGWASHMKLPILFVVQDNNLSILTEKIVRRNWNIAKVAKAFELLSYDVSDHPNAIYNALKDCIWKSSTLININTTRLFWHAGAGRDNLNSFDRLKEMKREVLNSDKIFNEEKSKVEQIWKNLYDLY